MKKVHQTVRRAARRQLETLVSESLEGMQVEAGVLVRQHLEGLLDRALQEELASHLGRDTYQRKNVSEGPWRNGVRPLAVPSPLGELHLHRPVLRQGGFRSRLSDLLRRGMDHAVGLFAQQAWMKGVSTRATASTLRELTGSKLSASDVSELTDQLLPTIEQWRRQALPPIQVLYLDALYLAVRRGKEVTKQALLVAIGVDSERKRHFLGWCLGDRETTESWKALLADLKSRGLVIPDIAVSDAHKAIRAAVREELGVQHQLCVVHKMRSILSQVRRADQKAFSEDFKGIFWADSKQGARKGLKALESRWGTMYPRLVEKAGVDFEDFTVFYEMPKELWGLCRCSNTIERFIEELRRRLDPARISAADKSLDKIVYAVASEQQKRWDRQKLPKTHESRLRMAA